MKKIQASRILGEDKTMQTEKFLLQIYIIIIGTREMSRVSQCSMQLYKVTNLQCVDERQVIESDIIVIVLDVCKSLLMCFHKFVDLAILPFFNFMDFCLAPKI